MEPTNQATTCRLPQYETSTPPVRHPPDSPLEIAYDLVNSMPWRGFLLAGLVLAIALPAISQPDRLARPISGPRTVMLAGSRRPGLQELADEGPVDPGFLVHQITVAFKPSPAQQAELEKLLADQQDPRSPDYHRWLTPAQ